MKRLLKRILQSFGISKSVTGQSAQKIFILTAFSIAVAVVVGAYLLLSGAVHHPLNP